FDAHENPLEFLYSMDVEILEISQPFTLGGDTLNRTREIRFRPKERVDSLIREMNLRDEVEFAERVPLTKIFHKPNDPLYSTTVYGYNWNWYLDKIEAEAAWEISKGSANIKIAVVDNAVYTDHPDLKNKVIAERDESDKDSDANPPPASNNYDEYVWSHGTFCSGLAAAESNNAVGIASIGYNISLIAVKSSPDTATGEYTYHGTAGVQWAAQAGADIINASWGGTGYSSVQNNFYENLKNNGIIVVAAAGNEGNAGNPKIYPAAYNAVIAVGATNADDTRASFSQYGAWLDISAPGGFSPEENTSYKISLLSTSYNDTYAAQPAITGKYDISQGTSLAAPIVTGLLGLMKSEDPGISYQDLKNCLLWGSEDIDPVNQAQYAGLMGAGRINAKNSMQCITGTKVKENNTLEHIVLAPNPSNGNFRIQHLSEHKFLIEIFDITGKKLIQKEMNNNAINVSSLNSGVYMVKISTEKAQTMQKMVIQSGK
ncbi:MAG: S8/S53 family peptidase, partial [Bacteroidales bacterium]